MIKNTILDGQEISFYYENNNHPITLLFLHGFASGKNLVISALSKIKNKNYNIIAFDYPGFGLSKTIKKQNLLNFYKITQLFIDKHVPNNTIILAHSLGTLSAIKVESNKIIKTILMSTVNPWYFNEKYQLLLNALIPKTIEQAKKSLLFIVNNPNIYGLALGTIAKNFFVEAKRYKLLFYDLLKNESLNKEYLVNEIQPLFIEKQSEIIFIHGEKDNLIPINSIRYLSMKLAIPLYEIPNIGHSPIFESPLQVDKIINKIILSIN